MQAVVVSRHGGPEVLRMEERGDPVAGAGELVVEVAAAGVNFVDTLQRRGTPPYERSVPYVPGSEAAGAVTAVGPGVEGFRTGDRVVWSGVPSAYAQRVLVPADRAVPVPAGVEDETAAAVLLQGLTAHYLSNTTYPVQSGDVVVVHAAAGGVGLLLTQMAKLRGGTVIATTSDEAKGGVARAVGADHVAHYDDLTKVVREVTAGEGAAVVYDGVGRATFDAGLASLRSRGYLVVYGNASGPVEPFDSQRLAAGGSLYLTRPALRDHIATRGELLARAQEVLRQVATGDLKVRIGGRYPLADAARAHADLESRRTTGKLILVP